MLRFCNDLNSIARGGLLAKTKAFTGRVADPRLWMPVGPLLKAQESGSSIEGCAFFGWAGFVFFEGECEEDEDDG